MDTYYLRINNFIDRYFSLMFKNKNIMGIGLGNKIINGKMINIPTITFIVKRKLSVNDISAEDRISKFINGVRTDVLELGDIAFESNELNLEIDDVTRGKIRPAVGGVSVGNWNTNFGGTLGYAVTDRSNRYLYILSCSHVLTRDYKGERFDKIIQPSKVDNGSSQDSSIGKLERWIPIYFGTPTKISEINEVDAAIAEVGFNDLLTQKSILAPKLVDGTIIKDVVGHQNINPGDGIWKIGRTTGKTEGQVVAVKTVMAIEDKTHGVIVYKNVIVSNAKSAPGDSGAIGFLKGSNKAFGMLTVGNGKDAATFLPLKRSLELLDVQIAMPL